jgi:16S rRNA (guanine966-N2)-methyltransferase
MQELAQRKLLEPNAVVVVEHDANHHYPESLPFYEQIRHTQYGDTAVTIYRFHSESGLPVQLEE